MPVFIQLFIRLGYMVIVFFICRHVNDFFGDPWIFRVSFIDFTVWRFYKAILIDSCITGQRVNQADVRAFGCLYRAHSSIMGIMHVTYLESGTVPRKTARPQCRQTPFMRQLAQRIILIHKL